MKMYLVVYSQAADYLVVDACKKSGVRCYTKMVEARGEGTETEPKLGTHVWPGMNNVLFLAVHDADVPMVVDMVQQLKQEHPRAGVRAFVLPLEEIL